MKLEVKWEPKEALERARPQERDYLGCINDVLKFQGINGFNIEFLAIKIPA